MIKPIIIQFTREQMVAEFGYPYFGYTLIIPDGPSLVYILDRLPPRAKASVTAHEMQHANDRAFLDGRVWHWEARAWWAGFRADWRGFFQAIWMSITDRERLILYWKRMTQGF